MPMVQLATLEEIVHIRGMNYGQVDSWKTSCLLDKVTGLPRPIGIVSYPGEKGHASIPKTDPDIRAFIWQEEPGKQADSTRVIEEIQRTCMDLIAGKYGPIQSFIGDGLHKFFKYHLDQASGGLYLKGDDFPKDKVGSFWSRGQTSFLDHVDSLCQSNLPVVWFTCWDGYEPDWQKRQGESASNIPQHIFPDLPGKLAKQIMGELPIVVHQSLQKPPGGGAEIARWQLRPKGDVRGAHVKHHDPDIAAQIPEFCQASFPYLMNLIKELEEKKRANQSV